ncbi:hypothetical protein G5B30_05000 [Sphingobacterium sp. SGG-5]|uniref:DUF6259 domain-containing protein n=1 Tax=Sphingobacterium sp. SGG-5 TaxID=2710881 RepID=UPI0013EE2A8C|nr:DUF6259 domain-containing protein [Sphingobacterium sp. SGG-5]NGM61273.1 hypothetical protein [Sphingobacterium sp. SGG-5]
MKKSLFILLFVASLSSLYANDLLTVEKRAQTVSLSNGELSLNFESSDSFKFLGLADSKGKTWTIARQQDLIWQMLMVGENGQPIMVNSQNAKYIGVEEIKERDKKSLVFSWSYPLPNGTAGKIFMTVSVNTGNTLSAWDIRSEFPAEWSVDNLTFPIITVEKTDTQKLILPMQWGVEYDLNTLGNQRFSSIYPSSRSAAQLMLLREQNDVFYFATHDAKANLKTFSARVTSLDAEFSNVITPSASWNNKGKFSLPWSASIGLSDKGWEDAVSKWYRPFSFETEWGKKKITEKKYPEWLLNSDLWLVGGHVTDKERDRAHQAIDYFGSQTAFHWYYWHQAPFDTQYPEYLPAKEGFDRIIQEIQGRGSHVVPYINGRLWDVATKSYENGGGKAATIIGKDGNPHTETYASGATNAVICPSTSIWEQKMVELTKQIQGDVVKADGVYYDQVAASRAFPCYDENHNHPPGGGSFWVDGYREIFKSVRGVLRPNSIVSTEQNTESYLDMFDLFLMVNYPQGKDYRPVPLFPIIYSDRALFYGFYIYNDPNMSFRVKNALTLLWGAQLNGGRIEFVQYPSMVENAAFLKGLVAFRKQNHDLFVGGRLLREIEPEGDNPVLAVPNWPARSSTTGTSSAVRAALWENRDGGYALVLVNVDEHPHSVTFPHTKTAIRLKSGECARINVDKSQLSSLGI